MKRTTSEAGILHRGLAAWALIMLLALTGHAQTSSDGDSALVFVIADSEVDSDGDGLPDVVEIALGTDPNNPDTDGDGIPDGWEVWYGLNPLDAADADEDPDNDGLTNREEYERETDPFNADTDGDGFWDGFEAGKGSDPASAASYPYSGVFGDVNCDGQVNAVDVQLVINAIMGLPVPVPTNVNGVGGVNAVDLQLVINAAMGLRK